jgi:hypothetical protein
VVDRMLADAEAAGVPAEELLQQMSRVVLKRALGAELNGHLGYVKGDPAGAGSGNSRNKTGRLWFCKKTANPATWHQIAWARTRSSPAWPSPQKAARKSLGHQLASRSAS